MESVNDDLDMKNGRDEAAEGAAVPPDGTFCLYPMATLSVGQGVSVSSAITDKAVLDKLMDHFKEHSFCLRPEWTQSHRIGGEITFEHLEKEVQPTWRPVSAPRIHGSARMIDVIQEHNRLVCELDKRQGRETGIVFTAVNCIHFGGGWGYSPDTRCDIRVDWAREMTEDNFGGGLENLFLERRIYEELYFDDSEEKPDIQCARWEIKDITVYVGGGHVLDHVRYVVAGFSGQDAERLRADGEENGWYENDPAGATRHLELANSLRVGYETECWFDVTGSFARPDKDRMPRSWSGQPHEDKALGITFPMMLGDARMTEGHSYGSEKLGYSLNYVTGTGKTTDGDICCDVYVYTNGCDALADGVDENVLEHFNLVKKSVLDAKDVAVARQEEADYVFPRSGLAAKWASFDLHYLNAESVYSSFLLLTSFRGYFIKFRCSCPFCGTKELPAGFLSLLEGVDSLFAGAQKP